MNTPQTTKSTSPALSEIMMRITTICDRLRSKESELAKVTKELADAQSDIAEEIKQSQIYKAKLEKCRTALDKIASWGEGAVVAPSFDEPHSAKLAREVLDKTK